MAILGPLEYTAIPNSVGPVCPFSANRAAPSVQFGQTTALAYFTNERGGRTSSEPGVRSVEHAFEEDGTEISLSGIG